MKTIIEVNGSGDELLDRSRQVGEMGAEVEDPLVVFQSARQRDEGIIWVVHA